MAVIGGGLALLVGLMAQPLGTALGLLDWPDLNGGRKRHARVTPLVGGLALTLAVVVAAFASRVMMPAGDVVAHDLGWLAFAVAMMFLIGASDDRFHLSPVLRLLAAMVVLVLVISSAPDVALAFLHFGGAERLLLLGSMGTVFTLLCLLGLLNAVNMADGKDGLVLGLGLIWSAVLAAHLPPPYWPLLAATLAALLVLLWFNMTQRLFLGDGGSYALSALLGLLAILTYNHGFENWRADDVAVLFAVPVFDTVRLLVVRMSRGRSPFEGDRDHLHHHLHATLGWPRGLAVYLAMVAVPNAAALAMPGTGWFWLAISLGVYATVLRGTGHASTEAPDPAE
ncbi:MraY family glycosyltransferase [Polymorphobacter multimanifer]|uniref:MraY family glycosyltransferase n=1 Tax=Polymorphobacter multimanifer TaxID=1070431 RepID=UPI001669C9D3|nr:MraY family glycosyltransferase [Polymorphobacter multimanifer]